MKRMWMACLLLVTGTVCAVGRPELVAKVKAGEVREARVSWWGFDPVDSTEILQSALTSGVARLVVDWMPSPWIARPLTGSSSLELVLEPGAEILAKAGEFRPKGACLLTFRRCENVRIVGYGAKLRMRHADYTKPPYEKSEWRHALSILSCRNVRVEGLTLAGSGGDGIYLGCSGPVAKNTDVVIRDVLCDANHRQGISVISVENLLIENTVMRETRGSPPAAGIDFEPNRPTEVLKNCVMRNCLAVNNQGSGYTIWAGQMDATSEPLDLRFENCTSFGDRNGFSFAVDGRRGRDVAGKVAIVNCSFEKPTGPKAVSLRESRFGTIVCSIADSRIVTTNAAGAEVVTKMDESWRKINLPFQHDTDFSIQRIAAPNLAAAHVVDDVPWTSVRLQPMQARHAVTYLVYADRARTLSFTGRQCRVGRYAPAAKPMVVEDLTGRKIATVKLPGYDDAPFSFVAPAAGFYRLKLDLGSVAFTMTAADAPVAIDVTDSAQGLISSAGKMWFAVPPKTARFAVFACGEDAERVTVSITDPQGIQVWEQKDISGWTKAVAKTPPPGLWTITASRPTGGCFEDARYDLAGVPGFLFLSDAKFWFCP